MYRGTTRGGVPGGCEFRAPTTWAFDRIDDGVADPSCPECGGIVKSATVSFGQALFPDTVDRAVDLAISCDLFLTIGSSLQVYPAAGLPQTAKQAGAKLAIVNDEATPFDGLADVVVRGRAGETLPDAVERAFSVG